MPLGWRATGDEANQSRHPNGLSSGGLVRYVSAVSELRTMSRGMCFSARASLNAAVVAIWCLMNAITAMLWLLRMGSVRASLWMGFKSWRTHAMLVSSCLGYVSGRGVPSAGISGCVSNGATSQNCWWRGASADFGIVSLCCKTSATDTTGRPRGEECPKASEVVEYPMPRPA